MGDRQRELKEQYKQMKSQMGVFAVRNTLENKYYLEATNDLKGTMNSTRFKLDLGRHRNRELQRAWNELGEGAFQIETLDCLDYGKDETKTDYTDDLELLKSIWASRLAEESAAAFY